MDTLEVKGNIIVLHVWGMSEKNRRIAVKYGVWALHFATWES